MWISRTCRKHVRTFLRTFHKAQAHFTIHRSSWSICLEPWKNSTRCEAIKSEPLLGVHSAEGRDVSMIFVPKVSIANFICLRIKHSLFRRCVTKRLCRKISTLLISRDNIILFSYGLILLTISVTKKTNENFRKKRNRSWKKYDKEIKENNFEDCRPLHYNTLCYSEFLLITRICI